MAGRRVRSPALSPDSPRRRSHGGPGGTHDYLEPLEALAATGRRVIFYDQLGCGKSATPSNPSLWTVDLYVREVDAVRQALELDRVHLLGQSWGGMLGMEYALTQPTEPTGLMSLTVADSPARRGPTYNPIN